jgi:hypothetical protein
MHPISNVWYLEEIELALNQLYHDVMTFYQLNVCDYGTYGQQNGIILGKD